MSISFDSASSGRMVYGGTTDFNFTCTNATILLVVTETGVNSITYNGSSLSSYRSFTPPIAPVTGSNCPYINVWYLVSPSSGTNTLSFSLSSGAKAWAGASYKSTRSESPEGNNVNYSNNGTTETQVGSLTDTVNTVTDNAWAVLFVVGDNNAPQTFTAGSNTTHRSSYGSLDTRSVGVLDSNGPVSPAGSKALTATWSSSTGFLTSCIVSIGEPQTGGGFISLFK